MSRVMRRVVLLLLRLAYVQADRLVELWRDEVHRIVLLAAFALLAVFFVAGMVSFAVLGIVFALWDTQRVLAFAIAAIVFALMALLSFWRVRRLK